LQRHPGPSAYPNASLHLVSVAAVAMCTPSRVQPLAACVRSVMASAPSATRMCGLPHSCVCAMSATMAAMRAAASSAEALACQMPTTARSAHCRRKM
jgi:hypothetical protein